MELATILERGEFCFRATDGSIAGIWQLDDSDLKSNLEFEINILSWCEGDLDWKLELMLSLYRCSLAALICSSVMGCPQLLQPLA